MADNPPHHPVQGCHAGAMTGEREPWEFERQHNPYTIEGQIESYGALSRGLLRGRREIVGRVLLGLAIACVTIAIVVALT
jgi:hypothetical protein